MTNPIQYQVRPTYPETHLLDVTCIIDDPNPEGQIVALPAWIPGSYLIRDFSRHIVSLKAEANGQSVSIQMLDKNTWKCDPTSGPLLLSYQVYAYDLTPRGAYVDNTQAFFNGSRIFLQVQGREDVACVVDIQKPVSKIYHHWRVATSLPLGSGSSPDKSWTRESSFREASLATEVQNLSGELYQYHAENYADLIDHPVQMGDFSVATFKACGVPHELVVFGKQTGDIERLCKDLATICEHHIQFFALPAPMDRYVFLLTVLGDGYGGLEHRFSSALQCRRDNFPKVNDPGVSSEYRTLLGLFSHEYFHAWNIKRIKPSAFTPYQLGRENYTRQLWIFEGITSYYDELALVRTKIISKENYLELLAHTLTAVALTPGRLKQTLEQSSFEAWTKFYKPDENSPNANISYYTKGALVALALDLLIRQETAQRCSLDDVMRACWQHYGLTGQGLPEGAFEDLAIKVSGCNLSSFFDKALRSTEDLLIEPLFEPVGVELIWTQPISLDEAGGRRPQAPNERFKNRPALDVKLKSIGLDAQLVYVIEGGTAQLAGLAPNDVIIAVNDLKVDRARLETIIANYEIGDVVTIHAFRRDELMTFKVMLQGSRLKIATLAISPTISETQQKCLDAWLLNP